MIYIPPIVVIVLFVVLSLRFNLKKRQAKRLEKIRNSWGKPKNDFFDFDLIGRFSTFRSEEEYHKLNEQTCNDIDFNSVFGFIDRTSSKVGQQFLFDRLMHPEHSVENLKKLSSDAHFFAQQIALREKIRGELSKLNTDDAYYISTLLKNQLARPKWFKYLSIGILALVILLTGSIIYPGLLIIALIPAVGNLIVHYWNKQNVLQFIRSFPQLNLMIHVCSKIRKMDERLNDKSVYKSISSFSPFIWKSTLLDFNKTEGVKDTLIEAATYVFELVKGIFLVEVFTLFHIAKRVESKKDELLCLFSYLGKIDAAISVASLRAGSNKTCEPEFVSPLKELYCEGIYHPLIENCISNTINIQKRSLLITGSNMSGKTSFLRAIIINSILAQTIYTCFADRFRSPILKQFSSIRIDDNLLEGKSYYFEEVNIMGSLIDEAGGEQQNIFILDEVFKGTNTIERIAAAKAVLTYLNRNLNLVIVATHDIELANMLEEEYDMYHFSENIEHDKLIFDHILKKGQLKTRNAIKLLEIAKYPSEIIDEARSISSNLAVTKAETL